jgi:D-sedoheptulose 7-phosphate isomerase
MQRTAEKVREVFARREAPGRGLADCADAIAKACHAMSKRFHCGGRLFTFGNGCAATDAQHIAVEFVHPVIVGKRALPALSLTGDVATLTGVGAMTGFAEVFAHQLRHFAEAGDIALGVSSDGRCADVLHGLRTAKDRGLLTVALLGGDGGDIARAAVASRSGRRTRPGRGVDAQRSQRDRPRRRACPARGTP